MADMDNLPQGNEAGGEGIVREFGLTNLSLSNKITVFLVTAMLVVFGMLSYQNLPKELFPEIAIPTVLVQTTYPGNSPQDIENLVSRPLEKEIESIEGISKLRSTSAQDASLIFVEFTTTTDIEEALQDVKDAVDKAKGELPDDLPSDPMVTDIDLSNMPILNVNLSGPYSVETLKEYAEYFEDKIEKVSEVSKVDIQGLNDQEVQINVDPYKLNSFNMSFNDIENAITAENVNVSGGEILLGGSRRSIRAVGEFASVEEMKDIVVKHESGNIVHLRDVAEVVETFAEAKSFARLDGQAVVTLQVVKKSGENLLIATAAINAILAEARATDKIPQDLVITITGDQSEQVNSQLSNLENSIIIGVIFVVLVLFYFLGLRNALLVGLAIPMSMFISFLVLDMMGQTLNMIVLFSLILALGMLVDNAIVAVENIYRFVDLGYPLLTACRRGVGEIAVPIISSTATTLAAFFPLVFWEGMIGEFMKILPVTLIVVLTASLLVALVIVPVFASVVVRKGSEREKPTARKSFAIAAVMGTMAALSFLGGSVAMGNLLAFLAVLVLLNHFFLADSARWFQEVVLVWLEDAYRRTVQLSLRGRWPTYIFIGTNLMLVGTFVLMGIRQPAVLFFPENEPNFINIIAEYPIGTDVLASDSLTRRLEQDVNSLIEPYRPVVESVLTTVGKVNREGEFSSSNSPHKAMLTVNFVNFQDRGEISTAAIQAELTEALLGAYPGVKIIVDKERNGPPTGSPINIELKGEDIDRLLALSDSLSLLVEGSGIEGIEGLKLDIELGKPELMLHIDRESARRFGLSTGQIASTIRTSLFGKEISDFKVGEDEYPIQLRMASEHRYDLSTLMNQRITFRNNQGQLRQVPISSVAEVSLSSSFGSINRKDLNRVITLSSNVIEGYNATAINSQIKQVVASELVLPEGYTIDFTGEQEEQAKSMAFLSKALLIAVALIILIMVAQFNSMAKPFIIMGSVLFSFIGVFGGISIFKMDFVVIMTGIGIVSLAGVVVNNAIVLIDYTDYLKASRKKQLGLGPDDDLPLDEIVECVVEGGRTRLRPVLLTAITTILGLFPMALGMNIDFFGLFSHYDPDIYFGGDNALFWGPMSWTVIFGLTFSTFLTLVVVPSMYMMANKLKLWVKYRRGSKRLADAVID